jgi:hypothetical protein
MKNILFLILIGTQLGSLSAQIKIGNQNPAIQASAIMEVTSDSNKGILFPRVEFTSKDLSSTNSPIENPTDGLMIFNPVGTFQPVGFYIWYNNSWNLISSNSNRTSDLLMKYKSTTNISLTPNNNWADLNIQHFKSPTNVLVNSVMAKLPEDNNHITLDRGSYLMTLTLNISTNEGAANGIAGGKVHTHAYKLRVVDTNGSPIPGSIDFQSVVNSGSSNPSKHILVARITFDLGTENTVKLQIARDANNSTYSGAINYTDASIHFLKASK